MGKLEKQIKEKGKKLSIGQAYLIKATKYKAGLMIIDIEDLHGIINKMKKDYPTLKKAYEKAKEWSRIDKPPVHAVRSMFIDMVKDFNKKWLSE